LAVCARIRAASAWVHARVVDVDVPFVPSPQERAKPGTAASRWWKRPWRCRYVLQVIVARLPGARTSSAPCRARGSASMSTYTPSPSATQPPSNARLAAPSSPPHPTPCGHLHVREPVCTARALPPPHPHALCPPACARSACTPCELTYLCPSPCAGTAGVLGGTRGGIPDIPTSPPSCRCCKCARSSSTSSTRRRQPWWPPCTASGGQPSTPWPRHSRPCAATIRRSRTTCRGPAQQRCLRQPGVCCRGVGVG